LGFHWMQCTVNVFVVLSLALLGQTRLFSQESLFKRLEKASAAQLQEVLPRFPKADANGDGTLTQAEAKAFLKKRGGQGGDAGPAKGTQPTASDIAYGASERNVLDFWRADGEGSRPLVIFIHGGGFTGGDKSKWHESKELQRLLDGGVSCAAINYRLRPEAPIQSILRDAARAVQFLRSKAGEWQLDKARFAAWGGSAGAGTSLWLGSRDDLADPEQADPVLRESSRVQAVVLNATQATYHLPRWEAFLGPGDPSWWKSPNETAEFYHFASLEDLKKPEAAAVLRECDMLSWISADDAPVYVSNNQPDGPPKSRGHYLHHPAHAREIEKCCRAAGVPCHWQESDSTVAITDPVVFVMQTLKVGSGQAAE
jgi:acetyl esterase/lipase